ncbi:hypothetical protein [Pseudomonas moorei]|uniref:hypothetical protein n=1 Tax=Pseudomonas moorei TaxID=395599 RepID=UPI00200EE1F4|nr:hypothetical protein [Pseudomonas moorei]
MKVELPPFLLSTLELVNSLQIAILKEDDINKVKRLKEDLGRERAMVLLLLNQAVDSTRAAKGD